MGSSLIAVVGGLNMDMVFGTQRIPDVGESMDGETLEHLPGGKGANTAIAAYRACHVKPGGSTEPSFLSNSSDKNDIRVFMNGAVGDDDHGLQLKARLEQNGVDVSGVISIKGESSGTCVVMVESHTGVSRNLAYQGANLKWKAPKKNLIECLGGGVKPDFVIAYLGIPREEVELVLETASKKGVDTLLNPSPAVWLDESRYKYVKHLVMSESEAATLSGMPVEKLDKLAGWKKAGKKFIRLGVKYVIITLGEKGAYYATHEKEDGVVDAATDVVVLDTTGAGSTFVGNYAVECIRQKQNQLGNWDIVKAIQRACNASAKAKERFGAQESIPWADELDE